MSKLGDESFDDVAPLVSLDPLPIVLSDVPPVSMPIDVSEPIDVYEPESRPSGFPQAPSAMNAMHEIRRISTPAATIVPRSGATRVRVNAQTDYHLHMVWQRILAGDTTVFVGAELPAVPDDAPLTRIRIVCDRPGSQSPLDEAREAIMVLLGEATSTWERAVEDATASALRRRMLGDVASRSVDAEFVAACNRLRQEAAGVAVLVLEHVDHADEGTLVALTEIVQVAGWLELPLLLHFSRRPTDGPARALVDALQRRFGSESIVAREPPAQGHAPAFDVMTLPPDVLRVMRVAALVGPTFEVDLVARLLDVPPGVVLEGLQRAADLGAPLADRGDETFAIASEAVAALQSRMLPSLRAHWHRRLADLVSRETPAPDRDPPRPVPPASANTPGDPSGSDYGELFEASGTIDTPTEPEPDPPPPSNVRERAANDHEGSLLAGDPARAARHLFAAGDRQAAVARYLAAIQQQARRGDPRRALLMAREAEELVRPIAGTPLGKLLQARLSLEVGRVRWHVAGMGPDYTLRRALQSLEDAHALLPSNAPASDVAAIASAIAGVCYDLGDVKSLERALVELTRAAQALQRAGDAVGAARLLNDQAAVHLRAGDPVRTTHLLRKSREVFESLRRQDPDDRVVSEELAETDHLLARLPLRAQLKPGREEHAYALALGHARAAEASYRALGKPRPVARVWETIGRLELARGRLEDAAKRLDEAARLQRRTGDFIGLARTASALSAVYAEAGSPVDALALLGESIGLNLENGSPLGLAYNRKAVETIEAAVASSGGDVRPGLRNALSAVARRLEAAEATLGRVTIPGD